jgi:RHS repeat-associated protein
MSSKTACETSFRQSSPAGIPGHRSKHTLQALKWALFALIILSLLLAAGQVPRPVNVLASSSGAADSGAAPRAAAISGAAASSALADDTDYKVGEGGPDSDVPYTVSNAIRSAYKHAMQNYPAIGKPTSWVHMWAGTGPWTQDFTWASIVYNEHKGSAYYIQGPYISAYVNDGGPNVIGLPTSNRIESTDGWYLLDQHTDFTHRPVQFFEHGFLGNDTNPDLGGGDDVVRFYPFYPFMTRVDVKVEHYWNDEPTNEKPNLKVKRARITLKAGKVYSNPPDNTLGLAGIWVESNNENYRGWIPDEGTSPKVWEKQDLTGSFSFRLEAWANSGQAGIGGLAGYLACDSYRKQADGGSDFLYDAIPLSKEGTYTFTNTCTGTGGIGAPDPFFDTEPPVFHGPEQVWQNGMGWAAVNISVSDNVEVQSVKAFLNGKEIPFTLTKGNSQVGIYAGVLQLKHGKNDYYLEAKDTSGNTSRYPESGSGTIDSKMDGLFGDRPSMGYSDDPVNTNLGNFVYNFTDLKVPAPGPDVVIERWFNAQSAYLGPFGQGWTYAYDMRLSFVDDANNLLFNGVQVAYPDGHLANFAATAEGGYTPPPGALDTLAKDADGYTLTLHDQTRYHFNADGRLVSITSEDGNTVTLTYTGTDLTGITDAAGRAITLTCVDGRISQIDVPGYGALKYTYTGDRLTGVTDTQGGSTSYQYDKQGYITSITSPDTRPFLHQQQYDENGRVTHQVGGAGFVNDFEYDESGARTVITDPFGNKTVHEYDDLFRLVKITDPLGHTIVYTYNPDNTLKTFTDKNGNTTSYTYDTRGNQATLTDAMGYVTTLVYDEHNHLLSKTDALGSVTTYEYDAKGRLVKMVDPLGGITRHEYDDPHQISRVIDPQGHVTETQVNAQGLPVRITDALGNTSTITYDAAGHRTSVTDGEGSTASFVYTSQERLVSVTDAEGFTTAYTYDADNNLIKETRADGASRTYTYNPNSLRATQTDWMGNVTSFTYDDVGRLLQEKDPLGFTLASTYDAGGNRDSSTDKRGAQTKMSYDPNGNLISETDALGNTTTYTYDPLNRVITTSSPCACASRKTTNQYDALGRLIKTTDALGNATTHAYDALGHETSRTDALGNTTHKAYDLDGLLVTETDALGHATRYEYNAVHHLVKTTDRLGGVIVRAYDKSGRQVSVTDQNGKNTSFTYDRNNRLLVKTDALGGTTSTVYDSSGNALTVTDALGRVTTYTYNPNGKQTSVTNALGFTTRYEINARGEQVKATDALNGVTRYTYDPAGALLSETNPLGDTRYNAYDILGRRVTETDRNGGKTSYTFDPAGNISTKTDALGGKTRSTVDANNNLITVTNPLGFTTTYTYDALNRQVTVVDALGGVSQRAYDALDHMTQEVDANGHATSQQYDAEGHKVTITDALGQSTRMLYDPVGNLLQQTDRNGSVDIYTYDALNRKLTHTNGLGFTETTRYDAVGNILETVNFRGYATRFAYDAVNNKLLITDALAGQTAFTYDALNRQLTSTDAKQHTTVFTYDAVGNRLSMTLPEGQAAHYSYDAEANRLTLTNAKGDVTSFTYDALNRQLTSSDPLKHVTRFIYDAAGQKIGQTDANGNSQHSAYDALGRLAAVTDALGYVTRYTYDPVGNQLTITDANAHTTTYTYDALNRQVKEVNPLGKVWTNAYDPEANIIEKKDANGQVIRYQFDAENQITAIHYPLATQDVTLKYDPNGNLVSMHDGVGTTSAAYDALDRMTRVTDAYNRITRSSYDAVGNRLSLMYPSGALVGYRYNANNWLAAMTDARGGVTSYTYDPDGLPTRADYPNSTWTSKTFNRDGDLLSETNGTRYNAQVITAFTYTLDAVGNRLQTVETYSSGQARKIVTTYKYNARNELTASVEAYDGPPAYKVNSLFTYDPAGNRLSMATDRDTGPKGPKTKMATTKYVYDAANHLLSSTDARYTYDANGNRAAKYTLGTPAAQNRLETYTYDPENRMTVYKRAFEKSGKVEQTVLNIYDGLGRRLNKGTQEASGVVKWTQYTLDGFGYDQIAEYPQTGSPRITQLYRGLSNQLVSMDEIQGAGAGSQYWFANDGLGSVSAATKQNGQSIHEYFYTPYGELIDKNGHAEDSSSWTNPHNHYLLTGKEWDEQSQLYYFGARFYDADAGVWLTQDPYRGEINSPMTLHRTLYVRNNPVNRIDPLGFFEQTPASQPWTSTADVMQSSAASAASSVSVNLSDDARPEFKREINVGDVIDKTKELAGLKGSPWLKVSPKCGQGNLYGPNACPQLEGNFGVSIGITIGTGGITGFINADAGVDLETSTITGKLEAGIEWDPIDSYVPLRAIKETLGIFGVQIKVWVKGGVEATITYNYCDKQGTAQVCLFIEVGGSLEFKTAARDMFTGRFTRQHPGLEVVGRGQGCVNLCNGDLTIDGKATITVDLNVGRNDSDGFNWTRDWKLEGEFTWGPQLVGRWPEAALLKKFCPN